MNSPLIVSFVYKSRG